MALATQCPHCGTMFRVAADQLKLRGGIVRCGACTQVFDGSAALSDLAVAPAAPPSVRSPAAPAPLPAAPVPAPAAAAVEEADEEPIYTLEFDHTFSPFGILPQVSSEGDAAVAEAAPPQETPPEPQPDVAPEPEPVPEPQPEALPEPQPEPVPEPAPELSAAPPPMLALPVDEELVAAPAPYDGQALAEVAEPAPAAELVTEPAMTPAKAAVKAPNMSVPSLLLRESGPSTVTMQAAPIAPPVAPRTPRSRALDARAARRSKLTPTRIEAPKLRVPESDEPDFVRRGRQRERSGKAVRIAMALGSLLLLLVLGAQAVYAFRDTLAARYPGTKPALVSVCGLLGCRVALPAQIDQMAIETGELTTLGGNAYSFTTLLRNQGESVQAWPSIELTLSDADDKPLVRRVFGPRDYLPAGPLLAAGFAARAEQPIKLNFRVEEPAPSGYHIAVFYP